MRAPAVLLLRALKEVLLLAASASPPLLCSRAACCACRLAVLACHAVCLPWGTLCNSMPWQSCSTGCPEQVQTGRHKQPLPAAAPHRHPQLALAPRPGTFLVSCVKRGSMWALEAACGLCRA